MFDFALYHRRANTSCRPINKDVYKLIFSCAVLFLLTSPCRNGSMYAFAVNAFCGICGLCAAVISSCPFAFPAPLFSSRVSRISSCVNMKECINSIRSLWESVFKYDKTTGDMSGILYTNYVSAYDLKNK